MTVKLHTKVEARLKQLMDYNECVDVSQLFTTWVKNETAKPGFIAWLKQNPTEISTEKKGRKEAA